MTPSYLLAHSQGLLVPRAKAALARLGECRLCPRACRVNRHEGEWGYCGVGRLARVASHGLHFGEEDCLVGKGGSGAIFFAGCNLRCVFCQNADISQDSTQGQEVSPEDLARMMLDLQTQGARNINLVSPSHVAAQVLEALPLAADMGLCLPLVYNTGGYDSLESLGLLRQMVDIFMPDAKFWDESASLELCGVPDYPQVARQAIKEMHHQVGDLLLDGHGLAIRGLLVRHLLLPANLSGWESWLNFLVKEVSPNTYVNLMDQYRPCAGSFAVHGLDRGLQSGEYAAALEAAAKLGLKRMDHGKNRYFEVLLERLLKA